ncbi:hypothetical protein KP509_22G027200 [Ceratopteris richardii]|uniref:non-specific serine/threonine protein kinase n=1 Tax=Ceratopteris richardii TaxID=49495 RepID=A0A8T2S670_CERRI|nr:hypothetical protein KP509_22G027200 [Ceratopteris richardii]KAH7306732.1 hypothetical protein KP509_22G027200 [Ceratopteris richardii]KAH7306733.1 hypothetical protein KP509_22G027200 [Ceratopteris richardii]
MGNCCGTSSSSVKKDKKQNPYAPDAHPSAGAPKINVLKNLPGGVSVNHGDITEKYVLGKELGRGEFGITYLCTDRQSQGVFACKSISKRKLKTAVDIEDVRREVIIMHHLPPHPNIVGLKAVYEDDNTVHLVMELCEGGELFDRIVARGHYHERAAANVTRTIVEVVQACHKSGVIHRDLKPENFLFANKKENSPLKAIDFGLSVFFKPGEKFSEIVGSPYYMAPEVLKRNYGPEVDVWSAGVILYILLCGVPPFWAETEQGVAQAILRGIIDFRRDPWPRVSEKAKSLVRQMLEPDPRRRLTAQQVLDHPWLQNAKQAPDVPLGDAVRARLKQFSAMNKLKKKALQIIAEFLSGEEVESLKNTFNMMDTDKTGVISFEQFKNGLHKLGSQLNESEIQQLLEAADVGKDGTLDYGKFAALTVHLQRMDDDEHLHKAFSRFDLDGNGFIDYEELKCALIDELAPEDTELINDIMNEVDTDKDGQISYDEFASMMRTGTDWRKVSRHYSRGRFASLSVKLMKDGSLQMQESGEKN